MSERFDEQICWVTRAVLGIVVALALSACSAWLNRPNTGSAESPIVPSSDSPPAPLPISQSADIAATHIPPTPALNPNVDGGAPTAANVLRRLREQLVEDDHCTESAISRESRILLRRPDALLAKIERALPLLDYVLASVEQRNLPGQFALIPWAESGFRADPGNRGKVQGLWQFTESTGRAHGLRIDRHYDGRRAAIDSTQAAVDHLAALQAQFADWRHALLAYNAGAYRVAGALRRHPLNAAGLPKTLAPHSYVYLQKISALACILRDPTTHGVIVATITFEPLREVARPSEIDNAATLAQMSGSSLAELMRYNAAFRDGDIADNAPLTLLLPQRNARTIRLADVSRSPLNELSKSQPISTVAAAASGPSNHVVRSGESLWQIARRYQVKLAELLRINDLSPRSIIRPGQHLRLVAD